MSESWENLCKTCAHRIPFAGVCGIDGTMFLSRVGTKCEHAERHDAIQEIIDTLEQIRDDLIDPDVGISTANLHIDDAIGLVRGLEEE